MQVTVNNETISFLPGDNIDLDNGDTVIYLTGKQSEAYRLFRAARNEEVQRVIEFIKSQVMKELDNAN